MNPPCLINDVMILMVIEFYRTFIYREFFSSKECDNLFTMVSLFSFSNITAYIDLFVVIYQN